MNRNRKAGIHRYLVLVAATVLGCSSGKIGDGSVADASPPDASPTDAATDCPGDQLRTYYRDLDGDGYGDPAVSVQACESAAGWVTSASDCDDADDAVHPGATELCGDTIDNNCDFLEPCLESLVAHWRLDDRSGSTAADSSEYGRSGALRGSPTWGQSGTISFDGVDDYIEVAHDDAFLLDRGTITLWFRASDLSDQRALWSKDASGYVTGGHLSLYINGESHANQPLKLVARMQSTSSDYSVLSGTLETGRWYHATFTFGPSGMALWIDARIVASRAYSGGTGTSSGGAGNYEPIVMGAGSMTSAAGAATPISAPFAGSLHDVRVYDRVLSDTEIWQIHELTKP